MTLKKRTPGIGDHKCKGPEAGVRGVVRGPLSSVRPVQSRWAGDVRGLNHRFNCRGWGGRGRGRQRIQGLVGGHCEDDD